MIYTNEVGYEIVGDTKVPLLLCFPFNSKVKSGDIVTTGQNMNYETFSNLKLGPLLFNSFHSIHKDLGATSGEKELFVPVGITRIVLMFVKGFYILFSTKNTLQDNFFKTSRGSIQ